MNTIFERRVQIEVDRAIAQRLATDVQPVCKIGLTSVSAPTEDEFAMARRMPDESHVWSKPRRKA